MLILIDIQVKLTQLIDGSENEDRKTNLNFTQPPRDSS